MDQYQQTCSMMVFNTSHNISNEAIFFYPCCKKTPKTSNYLLYHNIFWVSNHLVEYMTFC